MRVYLGSGACDEWHQRDDIPGDRENVIAVEEIEAKFVIFPEILKRFVGLERSNSVHLLHGPSILFTVQGKYAQD